MHETIFSALAGVRPTTQNPEPTTDNPQPTTDHRIQTVLTLLTDHLNYQWQIQELADEVFLGERQLRRLFLAEMQEHLLPYLRKLRLAKARELLLTTHQPINQIAQQVGIPDPKNFRCEFKRAFGLCPSEYRERHMTKNLACPLLPAHDRNDPLVRDDNRSTLNTSLNHAIVHE